MRDGYRVRFAHSGGERAESASEQVRVHPSRVGHEARVPAGFFIRGSTLGLGAWGGGGCGSPMRVCESGVCPISGGALFVCTGWGATRVSALGMSVGRRTLHAARLKVEMHREVTVEALAREGEARGHLREHAAR